MDPGFILEVARAAGRELHRAGPRGEYAIRCPHSDRHKNGDAHPSCRLNPEKNTWFCDPCGQGGGVIDLARELQVDLASLVPPTAGTHKASTKSPSRMVRVRRFDSSGSITQSTREWFRDVLGKNYPDSAWHAAGVLEGTVDGKPAIAFPQPSGGFKVCLYRQADRKHGKPYSWIFTDGGKADLLLVGVGPEVLIVAGEWDMLAALSAGFECVATGTGGEGTWKPEWSKRVAGLHASVIYDVDSAGVEGARRVAASVAAFAASVVTIALPLSGNPETDGKDLSDYLSVQGADALRSVLASARGGSAGSAGSTSQEPPVSDLIDAILGMDAPVRIKRRDAAKLIVDDLRRRGELVQASGGRLFLYDREDKRLYDLDAFPFRCLFLKRYQVNPAEPEFKHMCEAVKAVAREEGRVVQVVRFVYYDKRTNRLYVHAGQSSVLRLDGTATTRVDNGTDDVLFEGADEFEVIPAESLTMRDTGDAIGELIVERVNFARGAGVILSQEQQRLLLRIWILSIFFPELLPSRCLLLLYGEKGSGKTTTLRVVLKLLLGPRANVTPLGKEDGFNAAVSTEYLLVLDNVDSFCKWIEDRLATVATGQTIKLRKLYTTNEMLSFPTRCTIALTARTPRFRRDDVVDRLQILRVNRLAAFSRESDWYSEIEENRARLWAQILTELNAVVSALGRSSEPTVESIRMADWASLAVTIGTALGEEALTRSALEASELDKAHFLLEADDIYDLIHSLANDRPDSMWKGGELFAELKRRAEQADVELNIKSPRSLGRILHRLEPALKRMIRFEIANDSHDKQAVYTIGPLPDAEFSADGGSDV